MNEEPNQPVEAGGEFNQFNPVEILYRHAAEIDSLRTRRCFERPFYEIMSDALVWRREIIGSAPNDLIQVFRFLFNHRTGLILGEERPHSDVWQLGLRLFPRWAGFHPNRCRPSPGLTKIYRAGSSKFQRELATLMKGQ